MRILVTNDDGINAEGLRLLAEFAAKLGEVVVAAPKYQQSGRSHGVVIDRPFEVVPVDNFRYLGIEAYSIDASPADCVRFSFDYFKEKFDFVFAGINKGLNLGADISYSGTCGICFEAGLWGAKAIGYSSKSKHIPESAAHLQEIWDHLNGIDAFSHCGLFNVNIPVDPKGIKITEQGEFWYKDRYVPTGEGNLYNPEYTLVKDENGPLNDRYDIDAIISGYISVTPLTTVKTDLKAFKELRK